MRILRRARQEPLHRRDQEEIRAAVACPSRKRFARRLLKRLWLIARTRTASRAGLTVTCKAIRSDIPDDECKGTERRAFICRSRNFDLANRPALASVTGGLFRSAIVASRVIRGGRAQTNFLLAWFLFVVPLNRSPPERRLEPGGGTPKISLLKLAGPAQKSVTKRAAARAGALGLN